MFFRVPANFNLHGWPCNNILTIDIFPLSYIAGPYLPWCKTSYPLMKPAFLGPGLCPGFKGHPRKRAFMNNWYLFSNIEVWKWCAGLLTALKLQVLTCHMKSSGWMKSFWDFLVNVKKFYLDIVLPWFRFSINCWWQIWRMVNNRALRRSTHSLHLSSYIC
jgi:hypothetical protein